MRQRSCSTQRTSLRDVLCDDVWLAERLYRRTRAAVYQPDERDAARQSAAETRRVHAHTSVFISPVLVGEFAFTCARMNRRLIKLLWGNIDVFKSLFFSHLS